MIRHRQDGFTLVELMLSMAFLSILLVAIALLTIQVTNIYTKGITMGAVNQSGQVIATELRDKLAQVSPDNVKLVSNGTPAAWGRLCTGETTYAWNYARTLTGVVTTPNHFGANNTDRDVRFARISDPGGVLCIQDKNGYPALTRANTFDLIDKEERNIAIHSLSFSNQIIGNQKIYAITMTVGTNNSGEFISGQTSCKPPSEGFDEFCAVNEFDFTARSSK